MSTIQVHLNEPIGTVSQHLHGYLLENLGTVIYDGVWVGEQARIPHVNGLRKTLIDHMRAIDASVIRWPGGNFADYYDWKDGVGPRAQRPRRTNMWWNEMPAQAADGPQRYDPNTFGTPEFMRLCELCGATPFLNANVRGLPPQEFTRWVENCNSPKGSTSLADLRDADGSPEPHRVRYWGIGNEMWAAGGNMRVEEYAALYQRFVMNVPRFGLDLAFIACGGPPPATNMHWMREFLRLCKGGLLPVPIAAMSIHYYATLILEHLPSGTTLAQLAANEAEWLALMPDVLASDESSWYDVLEKSTRLGGIIQSAWEALGEWDPERRIQLAIDEWGAFYRPGTELSPLNIRGRAVTLRDALAAALTLDIFNQHAEKLLLANFTGLINQEGGLFLAQGEQFVATPIYHVFQMYAAHRGGQALRCEFDAPAIAFEREGATKSLWGLNGSASVRHGELTLTVVNPHVRQDCVANIEVLGGGVRAGTVATLTHRDLCAQNTFASPGEVKPFITPLEVHGQHFRHHLPASSVSCLRLTLEKGVP
jgi:alpha-N-arabinofuranosidase